MLERFFLTLKNRDKTIQHSNDQNIAAVKSKDIHVYDHVVHIGSDKIKYEDIAQLVINSDTVRTNGIGGSIYIRSIPRKGNPSRKVQALKYTFDDEAIKKAREFAKKADKYGVELIKMRGRDTDFRKVYFQQPR